MKEKISYETIKVMIWGKVPPEIKDQLREIADKNGRSISSEVGRALEQYVKTN